MNNSNNGNPHFDHIPEHFACPSGESDLERTKEPRRLAGSPNNLMRTLNIIDMFQMLAVQPKINDSHNNTCAADDKRHMWVKPFS